MVKFRIYPLIALFPNGKSLTRGILHDEKIFPDPFSFKPERFYGPNSDPKVHAALDYAFGFGRRVCPGRWMAQSFTWITIVSTLAAFNVEKALDANGVPIEPSATYSPGILACVFYVTIRSMASVPDSMS